MKNQTKFSVTVHTAEPDQQIQFRELHTHKTNPCAVIICDFTPRETPSKYYDGHWFHETTSNFEISDLTRAIDAKWEIMLVFFGAGHKETGLEKITVNGEKPAASVFYSVENLAAIHQAKQGIQYFDKACSKHPERDALQECETMLCDRQYHLQSQDLGPFRGTQARDAAIMNIYHAAARIARPSTTSDDETEQLMQDLELEPKKWCTLF